MYIFGCLAFLLVAMLIMAVVVVGRSLEMIGATAVWLWESLLNVFRPEGQKRQVYNPWTTRQRSNADAWERYTRSTGRQTYRTQRETSTVTAEPAADVRPKVIGKDEGEYIDYEETFN